MSELTRYLKYLVEQDDLLAALSLRGEISDLTHASSGHVYLTLKDESSQITCVLFRREAAQQVSDVKALRKGLLVEVHGFLTVYEPRGSYQVYIERVLPEGEGISSQRIEKLRQRLESEGLFAADRKRPLPAFPEKVALVTSPGSQAYHDVLHRLATQYPLVAVIEAGCSVQGEGAADEMVMAMDIVNRLTDSDVILLVRGGGAPEELAAFDDERLARAIFASRIPVVTGIGHQTDQSIADFVADHRAATPSLAAAAAVPDGAVLVRGISNMQAQMRRTLSERLRSDRRRWLQLNRALVNARPETKLQEHRARAAALSAATRRAVNALVATKRARLNSIRGQLEVLDPMAILARGYAVLSNVDDGCVITEVEQATAGTLLRARVARGEFTVRVEG